VFTKAEFPLLEIVPQLLDGLSIITAKLPVISEGVNNAIQKGYYVLEIKNISTEVLPIANVNINSVDNGGMLHWVENYFHTIKMESLALDIFKTNSSSNINSFYINNKYIAPIFISSPVSTLPVYTCPLDYHWGIYIVYNPIIYLHKYMFLFVPLFLPFVVNIIGLMFSIIKQSKSSMLYLLSYLFNIIGNCFLYFINMLEFFFYIISVLLYLGSRIYAIFIYTFNLIFSSINKLILLFKFFKVKIFNSIKAINIYILKILNLFFKYCQKYVPIYSIKYIFNNPQFIITAFIYLLHNISIRSLFSGLLSFIRYNGNYISFIHYIELCFKSGKFLPWIEYCRYMAWYNYIDKHFDQLKTLMQEQTNLLNLLRTLVSDNLYICAHGMSTHPDVILCIQVSGRARALLGINLLEAHALRIAAVYKELSFTEEQRALVRACRDAVRQLKGIDPNYVGDIIALNDQLLQIQVERSNLIRFSHDINQFFIIAVNRDGTLEYIYFF
jgi:hypothetical protein